MPEVCHWVLGKVSSKQHSSTFCQNQQSIEVVCRPLPYPSISNLCSPGPSSKSSLVQALPCSHGPPHISHLHLTILPAPESLLPQRWQISEDINKKLMQVLSIHEQGPPITSLPHCRTKQATEKAVQG